MSMICPICGERVWLFGRVYKTEFAHGRCVMLQRQIDLMRQRLDWLWDRFTTLEAELLAKAAAEKKEA